MKISELGEDAFLEELEKRFPSKSANVLIGIGDDAAAVALPPDERLLATTDSLVEGVHFTRQSLPPRFIGRKAAAVNASDIAAMGGEAIALLLSLCIPGDTAVEVLWQIVEGAVERAEELGMSLAGGNLAHSPGPIVVDAAVLGTTAKRRILRRSGGQQGDAVYVSGKLGAAASGLKLLERGVALSSSGALMVPEALRGGPMALAEACIRAHMDPEPRLWLGKELARRNLATACIDLSDGVSMDLHRLCRASGVGARIDEQALPLSPGLLAWEREWKGNPLARALAGGEDYELLFTVRSESEIEALRSESELSLTRIGELAGEAEDVVLVRRDGSLEPLGRAGWDHFRRPG